MEAIIPNSSQLFKMLSTALDDYVLIGGTAVALHLQGKSQVALRVTKDIDFLILELATFNAENGAWPILRQFLKENAYETTPLATTGKSQTFRFSAPVSSDGVPPVIELFSEKVIPDAETFVHRIVKEDVSAIVLPTGFVRLAQDSALKIEIEDFTVSVASVPALIALKALAAINGSKSTKMRERDKAAKHIKDIVVLIAVCLGEEKVTVSNEVIASIQEMLSNADSFFTPQRMRDFARTSGLRQFVGGMSVESIKARLEACFLKAAT